MLLKLNPENIFYHWKLISFAIQQSLPPITIESPKRLTKILEALLLDKLQCWALADYPDGDVSNPNIYLIGVTSLNKDEITEVKSLMIYSMYGFKTIPRKMIREAIDTLKIFADSEGCHNISAYTKLDKVTTYSKIFGASHEYDFLTIPLNGV